MKRLLMTATAALIALGFGGHNAAAEGNLFIYNWTDYTSPDLITKFQQETGIKVTLDTYDSNETLLAKLQAGGGGYDIVVPTHNFVPVLIQEGLIQKINASELDGYENVDDRWKSPEWDPGNAYTIPWQWGTTAFTVDTAVYGGDINTYKVMFEPPAELHGSIGMFRAPDEVIPMAQIYLGLPLCNESAEEMKQVLDLLLAQKPLVKVYNSDGILERLVSGDTALHQNWNGYSMRARKEKPSLQYAYPKEGIMTWFDNIAVPSSAQNYDNVVKFVSFMMQPENAAIQSNFAGYSNGIAGSTEFMDAELKDSPEINAPADVETIFTKTCSEKAIQLSDRVWTRLLQ
ncbi:MAG: extracellular solute-binding protein [Kiloniellales bacterium]